MKYVLDLIKGAEVNGDAAVDKVLKHCIWNDDYDEINTEVINYALSFYQKRAMDGDCDAMLQLGTMYVTGRGVPMNRDMAKKWFQQAIDKKYPEAYRRMGNFYAYERDEKGNPHRTDNENRIRMSKQIYFEGAALNEPNCVYECGVIWLLGKLEDKDYDKAFTSFNMAMEIINYDKTHVLYPDICYRLGQCYHHGYGTEKDLQKAKEMLEEARDEGKRRTYRGSVADRRMTRLAFSELLDVIEEIENSEDFID